MARAGLASSDGIDSFPGRRANNRYWDARVVCEGDFPRVERPAELYREKRCETRGIEDSAETGADSSVWWRSSSVESAPRRAEDDALRRVTRRAGVEHAEVEENRRPQSSDEMGTRR